MSTKTFEMNGHGYETDSETLDLLRQVVRDGQAANDMSAVICIMELGQLGGRIRKIDKPKHPTHRRRPVRPTLSSLEATR